MILESVIAAIVPIGIEGVKQFIAGKTGVAPTTVAERIQLDESDVKRLEAVAKLDAPLGTPSQWVVDLRASSRYIGALAVISVGIGSLFLSVEATVQTLALEAANIAFGFLFGSRIAIGLKR